MTLEVEEEESREEIEQNRRNSSRRDVETEEEKEEGTNARCQKFILEPVPTIQRTRSNARQQRFPKNPHIDSFSFFPVSIFPFYSPAQSSRRVLRCVSVRRYLARSRDRSCYRNYRLLVCYLVARWPSHDILLVGSRGCFDRLYRVHRVQR